MAAIQRERTAPRAAAARIGCRRFTQLVAALTAQEINHSQLGWELGIAYKTAQRWLRILRDTFQWVEISAETSAWKHLQRRAFALAKISNL